MLSLPGVIPGRPGVGEGDGFCSRANADLDVLTDPITARVAEPLAMAKVFSDRPMTHASAHVLIATDLRGCLGIIPSSGAWLNSATRSLEMPEERTFETRAARRGNSV